MKILIRYHGSQSVLFRLHVAYGKIQTYITGTYGKNQSEALGAGTVGWEKGARGRRPSCGYGLLGGGV